MISMFFFNPVKPLLLTVRVAYWCVLFSEYCLLFSFTGSCFGHLQGAREIIVVGQNHPCFFLYFLWVGSNTKLTRAMLVVVIRTLKWFFNFLSVARLRHHWTWYSIPVLENPRVFVAFFYFSKTANILIRQTNWYLKGIFNDFFGDYEKQLLWTLPIKNFKEKCVENLLWWLDIHRFERLRDQ